MNLNSYLFVCFTAISEALNYDTNLKAVSKLLELFFFTFGFRFAAPYSKAEPASIAHFLKLATTFEKNFSIGRSGTEKIVFFQ
jgi:hypothetical protein